MPVWGNSGGLFFWRLMIMAETLKDLKVSLNRIEETVERTELKVDKLHTFMFEESEDKPGVLSRLTALETVDKGFQLKTKVLLGGILVGVLMNFIFKDGVSELFKSLIGVIS
jgi:hypothetical protein